MKTNFYLRRCVFALLLFSFLFPATGVYAQLAKCKGKYFGNIIQYSNRSDYNSLWNQATSENGSKWGSIEGTRGVYNWNNSDLAYNWAKNNNGLFKFHTLVWGSQTPNWVSSASTATLTTAIHDFIKACSTHYTPMGGLKLIDVLNEPVNTSMPGNMKAALTAGYRAEPANANDLNNPYGWAIWPFQLARKYFPDAVLLINEYNVEMNWNNCRAPYIAMTNAIKNAPNLTDGQKNLIDGVGLQCHGIDNLTAANFKACIDEIWTKTGLPIHITEFDQTANPNETKQRTVYSTLIPVAWEHPHVAGITLWGYVQGSTWIGGNGTPGPGGTDSGISYSPNYSASPNGDRPAMTWLRQYLASRPSLSCCPAPAPFASCSNTNTPPNVSITSPSNNASFTSPASITINAAASDADGSVSNVQFYNGNTLLGSDASSPYSFTWTNVPAGTYTITARATDNAGASTTSTAITVSVTTVSTGTGVTTYMNPVLPGNHPDQTLLKVGNDFYTAGSSFHWTPNFPIYHSTDLVHWEIISHVVSPTWSGLAGEDGPKDGTWQGALAYFANKYWAFFFIHGKGQYFSNASDPRGPWTTPTLVQGSIGYDNSVFVDDDGRAYMLMKNGQSLNRIQEINSSGQLTGPVLNMDWVNTNNIYSWAEGPKMVKRNGRYYYFVAGNVYGGQYVLSSATLTASESSWTRHGNFFRGTASGPFTGPNHITAPVQIADGTWWCLGHSYSNNNWEGQGRQSMLFQVFWDANGVPYANNPTGIPLTAPNLPSNGNYEFPESDFFSSSTRKLEWFFHNTANVQKASLTARPGYLRLTPGTGTTHILQREPAKHYSVVTKVEINATANGQQAGLRLMNGEDLLSANLYSGYNGGKKIGLSFNGVTTEVNNTIGNTVWLKIVRNQHNISGYFGADGVTWTQIGSSISVADLDKAQPNDNAWVGTSIALYAQGLAADFDQFSFNHGFDPISAATYYHYNNVSISSGTVSNTADNGWIMLPGVTMESNGTSANQIIVNAASANSNGTLEVWIDNIGTAGSKIATIPITNTGGTSTYKDFTANVTVSGQHDLYLRFVGGSNVFRLNTVRFAGTPIVQEPYSGTPASIPGIIEAENYDLGGQGVAFNETTAGNSGNVYRTDDVDVEATGDTNGGYNVGWIASGEWLEYTVNVTASGVYNLQARVASPNTGGTLHVEMNGVDISGAITVPNTGDWQTYETVTIPNISLSAGQKIMRIAMDASWFNINYISFTPVNATPAVSITAPANLTTFTAPASISITADASDADGTISNVQFFNGTTLLGSDATAPYSFTWTDVAAGTYTITAKATDNNGAVTTSAAITVTVESCTIAITPYVQINGGAWTQSSSAALITGESVKFGPQPVTGGSWSWTGPDGFTASTREVLLSTIQPGQAGNYVATYTSAGGCNSTQTFTVTVTAPNQAPSVSITSPANNASFTAPATINITATASDADGTISNVQFFSGTTLLGSDATAPYSFSWTNVAAGTYTLTARATDNSNTTSTSTAITITVTAPPSGDIIGPDCASRNATVSFTLNPAQRANATNYNWWVNGSTQSVTPVTGTPYSVNIQTGAYYVSSQVCVGVNYSVSPYYATYCKVVDLCSTAQPLAVAAEDAVISPNPVEDNFLISTNESVESITIHNMMGEVVYQGTDVQVELNELPAGIYTVVIRYLDGRTESQRIQKVN